MSLKTDFGSQANTVVIVKYSCHIVIQPDPKLEKRNQNIIITQALYW